MLSLDARSESHEDAGELDAAESDLRRAIEISPDYRYGKIGLAEVLVLQSRSADALPIVQSIPESYVRRYGLALVYQALGRKAEADAALQELLAKDSEVAPVEIANVFAMRGDRPSALDWLQQDYDRRLYGIMIAKTSPLLRSLAHEPRFIALMQKVVPNQ